jgi:hypothetical protein
MRQSSHEILETLLRKNGLGWMIDMYAPSGQAIPDYLDLLTRIAAEYRSRCGVALSFAPDTLHAEAERNPHKVQAFLQLLRPNRSAAMLVMVWRVLQGLSIREVDMNYRERDSFRLSFTLARPGDSGQDQLETYESTDIGDAALLRHLGVTKVGGKPLFDGFYALRLQDQKP